MGMSSRRGHFPLVSCLRVCPRFSSLKSHFLHGLYLQAGRTLGGAQFDTRAILVMKGEALLCFLNRVLVLGKPLRLSNEHFISHLPYFLRIAYSTHKRVVEHCLLEKSYISAASIPISCTRTLAEHVAAQEREATDHRAVNAGPVHVARNFDDASVLKIRDMVLVRNVLERNQFRATQP
jgi:hypothetical protein